MTELDPGMKELIALSANGDDPTERQRSKLRAAVLAQAGGAALASSTGAAAVGATAALSAAAGAGVATGASAAVVGAGATVGAGASLGTAAAGDSLVAFGVKLVAIGAVAVGVGTGGYVVATHRDTLVPIGATAPETLVPFGASAPSSAPAKVVAAPKPPPPEPPAPEPEPVVNTPPPPVVPVTAPVVRPHAAPLRVDSTATAPPDTFEDETQALRDALSGLRGGQPQSALAALDAQDARFPHGVLGEERAVARIEALCALGRTGEASTRASRFLAQHPGSLQAARVRASCGAPKSQ